jgi:TonB family protein
VEHPPVTLIEGVRRPVLPAAARQAGVKGPVVLEVRVDEAGSVSVQQVVRGHSLLNEAAIRTVGQWQYAPVTVNGRPTAFVMNVVVAFQKE